MMNRNEGSDGVESMDGLGFPMKTQSKPVAMKGIYLFDRCAGIDRPHLAGRLGWASECRPPASFLIGMSWGLGGGCW